MSTERSGRCSNTIFFSRSCIPNAGDGRTHTSLSSVAPSRAGSVAGAAAVLGGLLPSVHGREENSLWCGIRHEFFGMHKHTHGVVGGSLDVGGVLSPTCNGANVDKWPRDGHLLRVHFTLCKFLWRP
jgi:hypothetical protein